MTLRDQALQQLTDFHQRQVVETLADVQGLPDDHPIWATVALLGTVIVKAGEGSDVHAELEATAQLNRQMPDFLARLEEVLASTQTTLASIVARLGRLEARPQSPAR
ncbi:hypothetical protein [Ferrimicrobium sp.]|uniref:hypothetical protein n=1 Tax=Ferrimicrobium sp. TaxID=2926050 RepID=UPI002625A8DB|nr:hypothetical protein [Ferrimicrobium sp.]